ncbi:MAG: fibro-slime domain-containing protein [Phycisphaeraceae bacterium]|nr:fibro-slime domain-containing protein [Phycisphaeraceae bacterium]
MHASRTTTTVLALTLFAGAAWGAAGPGDGAALPDSITLTGTVRDFRAAGDGGHADFQRQPTRGFAHYAYMVADELDSQGKPVMNSTGYKVTSQWKNSAGKNITPPRSYIAALGSDQAGAKESVLGGALTNATNFSQWFRDVPGVNVSAPLDITLVRNAGGNIYTFDDKLDEHFSTLGGFFPINGELYGNYSSTNKNFHFTFELDTEFVYNAGAGQTFKFTGDDDVWVFIDGRCVIDIGGVHGAVNQVIDLDRLEWLEDGESYSLKFFFAERHTTQSNFRIETTLTLRSVNIPATTALAD